MRLPSRVAALALVAGCEAATNTTVDALDAAVTRDGARVDAPRADAPRTDAPRTDAPRTDAAPVDVPRTQNDYQAAPPMPAVTAAQVPPVAPRPGVKAFPGAEGFGQDATGGRGGRVIYVTTLSPTGPGSLTEALSTRGPRYVLFKVSGLIDLSARIEYGDVTLAGHTSPGGIILRGLFADETPFCDDRCGAGVSGVHNVIVRHLRSRPAEQRGNGLIEQDALRLRHVRDAVIDHFSAENAVDEAMDIGYSGNLTIQDSILGETLGDHADRGGMLVNYSNPQGGHPLDAISVIRTAWVRSGGRYPEMARDNAGAVNTTMRVELANNLLWGMTRYIESGHEAGVFGAGVGPVFFQINWVGNWGVVRPDYPWGMILFENPTGRSTAYFRDNRLSRYSDRTDHGLNYCCNDFPVSPTPPAPSWARATRHDFPHVTYLPMTDVRRYVLAHAGAFPRDPMDRRLMGYVAAGVLPGTPIQVNPAQDMWRTDWGTGAAPAAPQDTDNDGMPDAWERAHGTNPSVQDHNGTGATRDASLAGYPNLEVYLHELAQQRLTEGPWGR